MITSTVTTLTTVGVSPMVTDRKIRPPTPGMLKMPSVTMAPPISAARSAPMKVTTGISELRRTCEPTTSRLDMPRA